MSARSGSVSFGKRDPQILVDDVLPNPQHAGRERGQHFGAALANRERHGLHEADQDADEHVDGEIQSLTQHGRNSFS